MKLFIWICGIVVLITAINYNSWKLNGENRTAEIDKMESLNPIINVQKTVENEASKLQIKILEEQEKIRAEAFNAQKIKVYVRARDTKTCMEILKINVINNEVAECNKDHYVEVRNDELDDFKKDNGL